MMEQEELLWRQYALNVELFKHYLKTVIDFNVFYYAITGAILSYYFSHQSDALMRHVLLFPALVSLFFGIFFIYAARLVTVLQKEVFDIRDTLGLKVAPDLGILSIVLNLFAVLMLLVATALIVLWCQ